MGLVWRSAANNTFLNVLAPSCDWTPRRLAQIDKPNSYTSDMSNRTPSCRVQQPLRSMRGGNVSRYTISDDLASMKLSLTLIYT